MRTLIYTTFILSVCIINIRGSAFEQTAEVDSFFEAFPTLFRLKRSTQEDEQNRLKRSLIENSDESNKSKEPTQRFKPPPSRQFEQYIFQLILQTHSLNLGNLRDIYVESNGDPAKIIARLNAAFGKEILLLDDEGFLKINSDEYMLFFNGYISQISKENPYLDTLLNNVLKPYISKLQVNVDEFRVPIETILERVKPHLRRNKRSANSTNGTNYYEVAPEDDEGTDVVRNFLQAIVDWIRNGAKTIVVFVIVQMNEATSGLFLPAFELLQSFLVGFIDGIQISI